MDTRERSIAESPVRTGIFRALKGTHFHVRHLSSGETLGSCACTLRSVNGERVTLQSAEVFEQFLCSVALTSVASRLDTALKQRA